MNMKTIRKNIKIWLEALESGKYAKGKGQLKQPKDDMESDGEQCYCCLGVAQEVCGLESDSANYLTSFSQIGLKGSAGGFGCLFYNYLSLAQLNDLTNYSFKKIASLIRRYPEKVFTDEVVAYLKKNPL